MKSLWLEFEPSQSKTLPVILNSKQTLLSQCWNVSGCTTEKNIENVFGAKISPSLTPLSIGILSDNLHLKTTFTFILLCSCLSILTTIDAHPIFLVSSKAVPFKTSSVRPSASNLSNHSRRTRHMGHCYRKNDEFISSVLLWTFVHGCASDSLSSKTYIV